MNMTVGGKTLDVLDVMANVRKMKDRNDKVDNCKNETQSSSESCSSKNEKDIARKTAPKLTCRGLCHYQCVNIELDVIQEYFQQYDAMSFNQQSTFLASVMEIVEPQRRRRSSSFSRKITVHYYLKGNKGEKVQVCRNMIMSTFQVTRRRIQILIDKLKSGKDVGDQRGKHKRRRSPCQSTEEIYIKEEMEGSSSEEEYLGADPIKTEILEQYPKTNQYSPIKSDEQYLKTEASYIKGEVESRSSDEDGLGPAPVISQIFEHYKETNSDSPKYQMPEEPHIKEEKENSSCEEVDLGPALTISQLFKQYQELHRNSEGTQINYDNWKDINNKRLRNSGECYISRGGKVIAKKEAPVTSSTCSCNFQCSIFDLNEIQEYFHHFYTLSFDKQSELLSSLMTLAEPRRRRVSVSNRQITVHYMLYRNSGETVRVCQKMICHVFQVTARRLQMLIEKLKTGQALNDRRGKHDNRPHRKNIADYLTATCQASSSREVFYSEANSNSDPLTFVINKNPCS